jgi:hypothetical protein
VLVFGLCQTRWVCCCLGRKAWQMIKHERASFLTFHQTRIISIKVHTISRSSRSLNLSRSSSRLLALQSSVKGSSARRFDQA